MITSFSGNGVLSWTTVLTNASYEVQWGPSLTSPAWTNSWVNLVGIAPTGSAYSASVPMFYRIVAEQPRTYHFPDYLPTDPNIHRKKVFQETNFLSSSSILVTNEITGFKKARYASGTIVGVMDIDPGWYYYNSGASARFLGAEGCPGFYS